jgi:hypothetical protein
MVVNFGYNLSPHPTQYMPSFIPNRVHSFLLWLGRLEVETTLLSARECDWKPNTRRSVLSCHRDFILKLWAMFFVSTYHQRTLVQAANYLWPDQSQEPCRIWDWRRTRGYSNAISRLPSPRRYSRDWLRTCRLYHFVTANDGRLCHMRRSLGCLIIGD